MEVLLYTILTLCALGVLSAVILYFVAQKFRVEEDPRIDEVEKMLPGANCGGCGFAGCRGMADALVKQDDISALFCPVGGGDCMKAVAAYLGKSAPEKEPQVATVRCGGTCDKRPRTNEYNGARSCAVASSLYVGETGCAFGCLGFGDCVVSCAFDAIRMNPATGLPEVDPDKCTACGACVKACPKMIIELRKKWPKNRAVYVSCVSKDKGAVVMKACKAGCIGCGKCQKVCAFGAITIENNLAYIDPQKCKLCRKCVNECPTGAIGAPAVAKVAKGDKVVTGQLIAEAGSFMSANIHAPVSGTVTAVDMVPNGQGLRQMMITIKREGDDWAEGIDRSETIVRECTLSAQEIVARIKDAGIVGMGGATFPTHVKLSIPPGKKAESLIINGVECEPYLTSDHRTMLEHGEELLVGVTILMKAIAVEKAYIGIENNKPDAIAHLRRLAQGYKGIEVVPLKVKYPQGGEKQLIVAITGREVPPPPALPIDVGAVVCNASTTYAVYQAVQKHKPLIERVVTITGKGVREPKNLLTRMGTPVEALIEAAGGLPADAGKVINGGPMMGRAMVNLASPVTKGCSGITVMSGRDAQRREASQCIKCAKCVAACPMGLEPYYLSKMTQKKGWEEVEAQMITSCIECGCCQASCPSYLPLLDWVRLGKQTVMGIIRARAAAPKK